CSSYLDLDLFANHDARVALAGQYEHGMSPSLDALPGRRPQPPSADGLALRQGGRLARRSAGSAVFVSGRCLQLGQDRVPDAPRPLGEDDLAAESLLGVEHRSEEHTSELQSRENLVCRL